MNEHNTLKKVNNYFFELGYSEIDIRANMRIKGTECDFVIYNQETPFIVVEAKSVKWKIDKGEIRFDPVVSELQYTATSLEAPYYVLTDSESFFWFKNDNYGRPELLPAPIYKPSNGRLNKMTKSHLVHVLRKLKYFYNREGSYESVLIVLLAWLLEYKGNNLLKQQLLNNYVNIKSIFSTDISFAFNTFTKDSDNILQSFDILNNINIDEVDPYDILGAFDEVFFAEKRGNFARIPRWLSDFLVKLSQIINHSNLVDIYSGYGNVAAALHKFQLNKNSNVKTEVINISNESALWTLLQKVAIGGIKDIDDISNYVLSDVSNLPTLSDITNVILAPPFGLKAEKYYDSYLTSQGVARFEDLCLEYAVNIVKSGGRVVALMPESLLGSGGNRNVTRNFLLKKMRVTAIISLPFGALLPYSNIKTSILVLDKLPLFDGYDIFTYDIRDLIIKDSFDCLEIPKIKEAYDGFVSWINKNTGDVLNNIMHINVGNLKGNNLSISKYISYFSDEVLSKIADVPFKIVTLEEVAIDIKRGKRIKIDEKGDFYFIGPAAIRPMSLMPTKLSCTSINKLPNNSVWVKTGDVVFNNISTYLGASAVIDNNMSGKHISQHVILIRPDTSKIIPEYLAAALNSIYVKPQIRNTATGVVVSAITIENLKSLKIPLPELQVQKIVANNISEAQNKYNIANELFRKAEANYTRLLDNLFGEGDE